MTHATRFMRGLAIGGIVSAGFWSLALGMLAQGLSH